MATATAAAASAASGDNASLASMLRDCAYHVERDQFHPVLYQAMAKLHAYTGEHSGSAPAPSPPAGHATAAAAAAVNGDGRTGSTSSSGTAGTGNVDGSNDPGLFDAAASASFELGGKDDKESGRSRAATDPAASGGGGGAPASGSGGSGGGPPAVGQSKSQEEDYLKDIKKEFKAIGKQFKKFGVGLTSSGPHKDAAPARQHAGGENFDDSAARLEALRKVAEQERDRHRNDEWCDVHFVMGCACKSRQAKKGEEVKGERVATATATAAGTSAAASKAESTPRRKAPVETAGAQQQQKATPPTPSKPCFQRPVNKNSNLIANGWIEQQRRSKMRIVWKDILASLVEGRRPGEETTLWIQRQVTNATTGKAELEALHQIPMKWLEDVNYLDFYGDHRFSLKIYNVADEFQFRTTDEASARNWVTTLCKSRDASLGRKGGSKAGGPTAKDMGLTNLDDWGHEQQQQQQQQDAASVGSVGSGDGDRHTIRQTGSNVTAGSDFYSAASSEEANGGAGLPDRMSIKELRAIAHGAGINTYGMERADLERIAQRLGQGGGGARAAQGQHQQQAQAEAAAAARAEEERKRQEHADAMRRSQEEAARAAAIEKSRLDAAAERQRMQEEKARHAAVEKSRQEAAAARAAAEEQRHQQEEEQRRQEWQRQQQEAAAAAAAAEEKRRKEEEALRVRQQEWQRQQEAMAAEKRRQEEAAAAARAAEQQRQWQQQQWQQQQWQQQQQQQQQQQTYGAQPPPPPPPPPPHQQQNGGVPEGGPQSPVNMKYAKQVADEKSEEAEQASITRIKREILINWALTPPMYQMLRPIHQLITTIHNSFPPAHGVPTHAYFSKWKPITADSLTLGSAMGNSPDEEKLKKAVRKIRFFLHPDKLPRDLNPEQSFMCRMLWDVTSDSWEEFCKQKEELDWIR